MDDTLESLRHQRNLLAEALGKLLVYYNIIRQDAQLTGPELLLAAETAVSHLKLETVLEVKPTQTTVTHGE